MEEELIPKPKRKEGFRVWVKPILFTTILYAGLAGGYLLYKKTSNTSIILPPPNQSQDLTTVEAQVVDKQQIDTQENGTQQVTLTTPVSITKTVVDAMPIEPNNAQHNNARIFVSTSSATGEKNSQPLAKKSAIQPSAQLPPLEPVVEESAPVASQNNDNLTQTRKNGKESVALTKAEAEAEAQNELLREAINKVRTLNDNKIAKAREREVESSVAPHPPIIQDETPQEERERPAPPKIEKQTNKVVIHQEVSSQEDGDEQAE